MKTWIQIFWDELELVYQDKSILLTCLVAPLLYAFFVGSIYEEKDVFDIPIAVVDMDHSNLSRKVIQLIDTHEKVSVNGTSSNLNEAMYEFNNLQVQGILLIPPGFERTTLRLEGSTLQLFLNNTKFLTSNEVNKGVQEVILTVSAGIRMNYLISSKVPENLALEQAQPIMPSIRSIYNTTNNYGDYLLPILLILIIQQTLIIGFGQSVIHSIKTDGLFSSRQVSIGDLFRIFSAKGAYYLLLYASFFFLFYKLIFPYYHLVFQGSFALHFALSTLFVLAVMIFTLLLASFFKTTIGWTEIMAFSTYPLFLVSGYSWPLEAMPTALRYFAQLLPSTPYFEMFNRLSMQGASFWEIKDAFNHLILLILLGVCSLIIRFQWIIKKQKKQLESENLADLKH